MVWFFQIVTTLEPGSKKIKDPEKWKIRTILTTLIVKFLH